MKYIGILIIIPLIVFGQSPVGTDILGGEEPGATYAELGEDTTIFLNDQKKDTVYTLDDVVMEVKPDKISLGEIFYPIDPDEVVVVNVYGEEIPYHLLPVKATVRVKFVKEKKEFVIKRIRVLKNPE
ncbi:hypothetical protein DRQ33_05950 [bacterium]|nr:MAG: hypothetical protein DRQ33_05950 [bacterium]